MTMQTPGRPTRPRRSERSRQLYEARSLPAYEREEAPDGRDFDASYYAPNEEEPEPFYTPNEEEPAQDYAPIDFPPPEEAPAPVAGEERAAQPAEDLSAYYRRPRQEGEEPEGGEIAYAPPTKLSFPWSVQDAPTGDAMDGNPLDEQNGAYVYHPRERDWAQTSRQRPVAAGYQVEVDAAAEGAEAPLRRRRRKRWLKRAVTAVCVLGVLGGAGYYFREPLTLWIGQWTGKPAASPVPYAAITTPAPVKAYDAATPTQISAKTSQAISQLSGALEMDPAIVTDACVVQRAARADGLYDYYLFDATDGRLLSYFEGLDKDGVTPMPDGGFYVRQAPYLVGNNGAAMIRTANIEQSLGESVSLQPLYNGWAIVASQEDGMLNYVNLSGQLLSRLWFAKAYPMTGTESVAYVDTGSLTDLEGRYALYIVDTSGNASKWWNAGDMTDVVYSACGAAYLDSGDLYLLKQPDAPLLNTDEVSIYADCDAMVVRDVETGKYGLFVHGEQHYDFVYDSIEPVESDVEWSREVFQGQNGSAVLRAVVNAAYPQPLSHYFLLKQDDREEYVALSTQSVCPVVLQ